MISIYTDGAARGNPGPGGYGTILLYQGHKKEISGGFRLTTNNRMELMAVIIGLESLKNEKETVTIYSDSKYVVDSIAKRWVFGWEKKGFLNKKNPDLWKRFLVVYRKHTVHIEWCKGPLWPIYSAKLAYKNVIGTTNHSFQFAFSIK